MKHDNYRITRPMQYPKRSLGHEDPSARQGYYLHADDVHKAVRKIAKDFRDRFFDVQEISAEGELGRRRRYRRDGLEVMEHGDRFILCRFPIGFGCMVEESSHNLGTVLSKVPDHIHESDDQRLSVCEVGYWVLDPHDPSDGTPCDVTTLYEIQHYEDPSCDEEEDEDEEDESAA